MKLDLAQFSQQLPLVLAFVTFRALPFAGYACVSPRVPHAGKVLAALLYASFVAAGLWLGQAIETFVAAAVAAAYFLALVPALIWLRQRRARRRIDALSLFGVCAVACLVAPAAICPSSVLPLVAVLGWEKMLAAYSYCAEGPREERPSYRECAFFLVVNPILVYPERGKIVREPGLHDTGSLRIAQAVLGMYLRAALVAFVPWLAAPPAVHEASLESFALLARYHATLIVAVYLGHSSLASLQIGFMRLLGYEVMECYRLPLLSRSPLEFWRRWNIWVGHWVLRYVFNPLALGIRRRSRALGGGAHALALLCAFVITGLLHDVYFGAVGLRTDGSWSIGMTLGFAAFALILLAWTAIARRVEALRGTWIAPRWLATAGAPMSWLVSMAVLVASAAVGSRELIDPLVESIFSKLMV